MFLSVIIPAYNEEKRITKTLLSVEEYLKRQPYNYEILVVSDGSTDSTIEVVSRLKEQISSLRIIDNKKNHGKGFVVRQGMLEAVGDIRLFMDADNSTNIDQVSKFLPYFQQGYDVVIGSRRAVGSVIVVKQSGLREFLGWVFRLIVRILVPLGVSDSQAGFKAFSKKTTEAVFAKQTIFRWAFDVEILAIAKKMRFKIKETPVIWANDAQSHVKIGGMIKMFFEVLTVRKNLWSKKY